MTRRRPHRLIDLLLGVAFLAPVAFWAGSLSPLLGVGLVTAVAGFYLASLPQGERDPGKRPLASVSSANRAGPGALDALDKLLAEAPPIPLTDWVRVDAAELVPLAEAADAEVAAWGLADQAHELTRVVLGDRQIPFTGQLRVDRRRAQRLLDALRSTGPPNVAAGDEESK